MKFSVLPDDRAHLYVKLWVATIKILLWFCLSLIYYIFIPLCNKHWALLYQFQQIHPIIYIYIYIIAWKVNYSCCCAFVIFHKDIVFFTSALAMRKSDYIVWIITVYFSRNNWTELMGSEFNFTYFTCMIFFRLIVRWSCIRHLDQLKIVCLFLKFVTL